MEKGLNMRKLGKKGISFSQLSQVGLLFVLVGITLGIGAYVNSQVQTVAGWGTTSTEYLAVQNATVGIANLAQWLPIIAVVIAAGVVIGVLVMAFSTRRGV